MAISAHDIAHAEKWVERHQGQFARSASVDHGTLVIKLRAGNVVRVPVWAIEGVRDFPAAQLTQVEVTPMGDSLHFPLLDLDVYVPKLVELARAST